MKFTNMSNCVTIEMWLVKDTSINLFSSGIKSLFYVEKHIVFNENFRYSSKMLICALLQIIYTTTIFAQIRNANKVMKRGLALSLLK